MVFTQTLGETNAKKLKKPNGKNVVRSLLKENRDIKNIIDASVRAAKPKTNKDRNKARQRAICKALNRNQAFSDDVTDKLTLLVTRPR